MLTIKSSPKAPAIHPEVHARVRVVNNAAIREETGVRLYDLNDLWETDGY